ncbi:hypothetical protein OSB04_014390, partial [Centaurea solstitialis]
MEEVKIKSYRGQAKVLGTAICMAGTLAITFWRGGFQLKGFGNKPLIDIYNPHNHVKENWVKGAALISASKVSWSLWLIFQICKMTGLPSFCSYVEAVAVAWVEAVAAGGGGSKRVAAVGGGSKRLRRSVEGRSGGGGRWWVEAVARGRRWGLVHKMYPAPLSMNIMISFFASLQSCFIALFFARDASIWKLEFDVKLMTILY